MTLNLFRYFTLPHLWREKTHNLLTITGICLGVAVFVAIEIANQSTLSSFRSSMDSVAGKATIQIDGGELGVPEKVMLNLTGIPGIIQAAPIVQAYPLVGESEEEVILVQGVDLLREDEVREYINTKGKRLGLEEFEQLIQSDSIALSSSFAERNHLNIGDSITLTYNQVKKDFIIRALLEKQGAALALGGDFALMDIATAQESFDKYGYLDRIDIISSPDLPVDTVIKEINKRIPPGLQVKRTELRNRQIENILSSFQINLRILSYIAILVGIFLIYNTLNVSVERRRQEIAIMRAIGASRAQIYGMILQEATILGLIGSLLGIIMGFLLARSALSFVSRTVTAIYLLTSVKEIALTKGILLTGLLIGVSCTVFSSLIPARRASKISPHLIIGIYDSNGEGIQKGRSLWLTGIAFLLFAGALLLSYLSLHKSTPVPGYLATLLILSGFTCITPGFTRGVLGVLTPLIDRIFGLPGKFSIQNLRRSLPRVSVAIAALMASLAMLISIAIMVESFRGTVYMWTEQTLKSDLYVTTPLRFARGTEDRLKGDIEEIVKNVKGVSQMSPYRFIYINYGDSKIGLASNDFDTFIQQGNIWLKKGDPKEILKRTKAENGVIISENLELKYNLKAGENITLNTPTGVRTFLIHGIYYDYSNDLGVALMDRGFYKQVWEEDYISTLGIFLEPGADPDEVTRNIHKALGHEKYLLVMKGKELREKAMDTFSQSFHIFFALEIIAMIVALLGITNTLIISIMHRQREIAVLRAIGGLKGQVRQMIMIEAGLMGLIGNILGICAGVVISLIMIFVITRQSFGWSIQYNIHLPKLLMSLGPVLLVSLLAGYIPACKAASIPLARAIRYE